ncbi:hypothetical protein [Streptomyces sp. NPDC046925]|uniref:hypothetical protein n=1 Tax=Streptomyces sp. NPDC046925 TaxID=3155375 RepID=UPI0033DF5154
MAAPAPSFSSIPWQRIRRRGHLRLGPPDGPLLSHRATLTRRVADVMTPLKARHPTERWQVAGVAATVLREKPVTIPTYVALEREVSLERGRQERKRTTRAL